MHVLVGSLSNACFRVEWNTRSVGDQTRIICCFECSSHACDRSNILFSVDFIGVVVIFWSINDTGFFVNFGQNCVNIKSTSKYRTTMYRHGGT